MDPYKNTLYMRVYIEGAQYTLIYIDMDRQGKYMLILTPYRDTIYNIKYIYNISTRTISNAHYTC